MKRSNIVLSVLLLMIVFFVAVLVYPVQGVSILAYHMVSDEDPDMYAVSTTEFTQQMKFLSDHGYHAISLAEMTAGLQGKAKLPEKPIVITFDDGYVDNLTNALPIMETYGMKGTVFMIASRVGEPDYLTWDQLKDMQARNTEIGSHTMTHVMLSEVDAQQKELEVRQSKEMLERKLGKQVVFLAYPFGNYDRTVFAVLQQSGYQGACTGKAGMNRDTTNPYALHRVNLPRPKFGLLEFRLRLLRAEIYGKLNINS